MALTVGQVAKATGMAAKTIRYYEQVGVLPPPGRTAAGYRQYGEQAVQQLRFIRRARALGLSVHHLKTLAVALSGGPRAAMRPRLLEAVRAHLSAVQHQISELGLLQRQLEHVLRRLQTRSRARSHEGCRCLDLEEVPVRGTACRCHSAPKVSRAMRKSHHR
jgi:MerR family transcriptional regulator, copper efflux regulator